MSQQSVKKGKKLRYNSTAECFILIIRLEGLFALWSGLVAYFIRLGPNTALTLVFMDILKYYLSISE